MKVGDTVVDEDGNRSEVLEVIGKVFCIPGWKILSEPGEWWTFEEAESMGWELKEDKPQKESSMYKLSLPEVSDSIDRAIRATKSKGMDSYTAGNVNGLLLAKSFIDNGDPEWVRADIELEKCLTKEELVEAKRLLTEGEGITYGLIRSMDYLKLMSIINKALEDN